MAKQVEDTPLLKQFFSIKAQYPEAILLYRVGDFYETYSDDALLASKVLGIVLTKRSNGDKPAVPMAGVPHHALGQYLPKLVRAGYKVAICDPVYPVYVDTNVMSGRSGDKADGKWSNIYYMPCLAENNFLPQIPNERVDIIYLCFPNNPTGMAITKDYLKKWVDYANENKAVILYDSAYEAFVNEENVPHSIYEIDGAKTCAIEFRSFSKTAGFTGVRCGYTVVPHELKMGEVELNKLWARRQATKFNGVSYITQRAAEAVYSDEGKKQIKDILAYYQNNAKIIYDGLASCGFEVYGAKNSPYVWLKTPDGMGSWEFFDLLLNELQVVGTPGEGFGPAGEGYFRLTAFGSTENTKKAVERIKNYFAK